MQIKHITIISCILFCFSLDGSSSDGFNLRFYGKTIKEANLKFEYENTLLTDHELGLRSGKISLDGSQLYQIKEFGNDVYFLYRIMLENLEKDINKPERVKGRINGPEFNLVNATFSENLRTVVFTSSPNNIKKDNDLFIASQNKKTKVYQDFEPLTNINERDVSENHPWLSADALRLYFIQEDESSKRLMLSSRTSTIATFNEPAILDIDLPAVSTNMDYCLVNNEKEIILLGGNKFYYSKRTSIDDNFSKLTEIGQSNNAARINGFSVSQDKKELYLFISLGNNSNSVLRFRNPELSF